MLDWISDNRAVIAALLILLFAATFIIAIYIGVKQSALRAKDEVFGDPDRTRGGWYWALCGVSALMLVWFYYSWGMARAFFPTAANEFCQVAKVEEALSPITATLPIGSRYYKSTTLVTRNGAQLDDLQAGLPVAVFSASEANTLNVIMDDTRELIAIFSNPAYQNETSISEFEMVAAELDGLSERLRSGYDGYTPTAEALAQPNWGTSKVEIPLLPETARGMMLDEVARKAADISKQYLKLRNQSNVADALIAETRTKIDALKAANKSGNFDEAVLGERTAFVKAVERIFKRVDDGTILPADSLVGVNIAIENLYDALDESKGGLRAVEALFMPGDGIVKSRTQCTEQGPGRWLPKPTDVVGTFWTLGNPDLEAGGGYKGTVLLWWKWLPVSSIVDFIIPDGLIDMLPGSYGTHDQDGQFMPNYKDKLLAFAQGEVYLGSIPMLDGHIWDSMFRVIVAMALGILVGVPLGIYMGVSRFFKSFFDPLIELYRPVPPLAWAPLILTIFGIQDDGKIFLLFMVAFAIMVISARTGASGTQLSKIRASHSLGASNRQILRYVILPNALPEILTGIRIAIGVCWGTLVAAEMLAGTTGVGFIENVARTVSDYELIWVTILIMGVLGLLFDLVMRYLISRLIPWRGKG